jgi:peptidoglycan/xylan/chitin deacetylase (PgdA/CDA1 family)
LAQDTYNHGMGRHRYGIAAALLALVVLAWLWPEGEAPPAGSPAATEPTGTEDPASDESATDPETSAAPETSAEPTSPAASPTPETPDSPAVEQAAHMYDGPLGTRIHTGDDSIALTFDDGPSPVWTPKVLDMLRERGIKATFCLIGAYAEAYPELVADIAREGHTLCNHSWFHEFNLGSRGEDEIRANLQRTNDAITKAAPGASVAYFRHPGGQWTTRAIAIAADLGMESVHWAVDPSDWDKRKSESQIRQHMIDRTGPGAIILLHDGASNQRNMCGALGAVFDEFDRRGYTYRAL